MRESNRCESSRKRSDHQAANYLDVLGRRKCMLSVSVTLPNKQRMCWDVSTEVSEICPSVKYMAFLRRIIVERFIIETINSLISEWFCSKTIRLLREFFFPFCSYATHRIFENQLKRLLGFPGGEGAWHSANRSLFKIQKNESCFDADI